MNTTLIIEEEPDNNTDTDPANANEHILCPSNHLIFTAAERVVPIQYPIKIYKQTAMYKLLDAEHNVLLAQGISNSLAFQTIPGISTPRTTQIETMHERHTRLIYCSRTSTEEGARVNLSAIPVG